MENLHRATIIIQRFYRYCIKWEREENDYGELWPIDMILQEPFDPNYAYRRLLPTGSKLAGKRFKVQIYDIRTLWQTIYVSGKAVDPLTEHTFNHTELCDILDFAVYKQVINNSRRQFTLNFFYPPSSSTHQTVSAGLDSLESAEREYDQQMLLIAAIKGDFEKTTSILLKHEQFINTDMFLPNKFYDRQFIKVLMEQESVGSSAGLDLLPAEITHLNTPMAIVLTGDSTNLVELMELGVDPFAKDQSNGLNCAHLAAMVNNINILKMLVTIDQSILMSESSKGAPYSILEQNQQLDLLFC